jgi:hypothetical protein
MMKAPLNLGEQSYQVIHLIQVAVFQRPRLPCHSILLNEAVNETELNSCRFQDGSLLGSEAPVALEAMQNHPAIVTAVNGSWPLAIQGRLAQVLEAAAKRCAIGGQQLSGDRFHRTSRFILHLSHSLFSPVGSLPDLLAGVENRPDGHDETQEAHGHPDNAHDVTQGALTKRDAQDNSYGQDAQAGQ